MHLSWLNNLNLSLTALYGAAVIGMSAAISHVFLAKLDAAMLASLLSSTAILAFQTLALLALSLYLRSQANSSKWLAGVAFCWHLGLWLFVYTVWAGLFALPLHFSSLAPIGGQLLLLSWLALALTAWSRT